MQPWWWRSVAACTSVLAFSGLVAVIAGAVGADRATAVRLAADDLVATAERPGDRSGGRPGEQPGGGPADPPDGGPADPADPAAVVPPVDPAADLAPRVPDGVTATTVAVPPDWRVVPSQDVVEVPEGRFEDATILRRGENTAVLVGLADPARVSPRADPAAPDPGQEQELDDEARRLADAYADLLAPDADTANLTDNAEPVADLPTRTSVRRIEDGDLEGALVRVSTVAAPGRTLAVLAVARPSPTIDADGEAADAVVRSLRLDPA